MKILSIGISPEYPEYLKNKIQLSNIIAVIIAFAVALPFAILCQIFFRPIAYITMLSVPFALMPILLNYLKFHTAARVIISLVPIISAAVSQGYLSTAGEPVIPSMSMLVMSFSLIMFVVFDLHEKIMLVIVGLIVLILMLLMDTLNNLLEIEMDTDIIKIGLLGKLVIVISAVSAAGCIVVLAVLNRRSETQTNQLLKDAVESKRLMEEKELSLKENLTKLEAAQQEEQRRQWINEGLSKGLIAMRNETDLTKLGNSLLAFIVRYVNANQGGLFLVNDDNPNDVHLALVAAYAYEKKKFVEKRIDAGQGLIGQAYLEQQTMLLKQVPKDYVHITSGLGTANPGAILIVPLKINGSVQGILELASFNSFQPHEIEFLESFGESVAAHFQSGKISTTTQQLLETTRQQTEEMRAQEEEMRQNMEELSATQEELIRKEQEYIKRIHDLEAIVQQQKL